MKESPANPRPPSESARSLLLRLLAPIDVASLVYFRIAFGLIMLWEVVRYVTTNRIERYYIEPDFFFKYYGFGWVHPWSGEWMHVHFAGLGILSVCIMFGVWYRLSATLFFLGFTYVFLLDQAQYLNHFYLVCLVSFLMIFLPAHRAHSFDARRREEIRSDFVPAWTLWLLRAQIGIVYTYAGIAKVNADWLRGEPLRTWLSERTDLAIIGGLFAQEWCVTLFSYGGLLFDLSITPLLLWRRTRLAAFGVALSFHLLNGWIFSIGIFPWFMIAATALFFAPDWPRRYSLMPMRGEGEPPRQAGSLSGTHRLTIALLGLYLAVQLLVPLRHVLYPGKVHWTEEGHRFSWHMKLRDKSSVIRFDVTDPDQQESWSEEPRLYLTPRQNRKMAARPDMILQFAHFLRNESRREGYPNVEVRVETRTSLNGRSPRSMIDPTIDLAKEPRTLRHAAWILPLTEPLQP